MKNADSANLTSGRLLARNTAWNLIGVLFPMAVAVLAIPPLIRALGMDRFGLLSLAWVVIGYFSLLDLGIGRALTKLVADKLAADEGHTVPPLVWTSLLLLFLLGIVGGLITVMISPWLVHEALKVPAQLQPEALLCFYLLAISIPIVTVTSGLRGLLEAQQRFRLLNLIRLPMSVFSFAGPLLVLPVSHRLVPVIGILVIGRIIGLVGHLFACFHTMPILRHQFRLHPQTIWPIVKLGGWMNLTNLLGPFIVYMDRFLIGALVSVSAVGYYAAPFEIVTRLSVIPSAVAGVLFPAFASSLVQNPERTKLLLGRGIKYIFIAVFPIVLFISTFAGEILSFWLGSDFARNGGFILRWFAVGVLASCLAQLPFVLLQSAGRPDIPAKFQMVEMPIYLVTLFVLVKTWGIRGAAVGWAVRFVVEAGFLFLFAHRMLPHKPGFLSKLLGATTFGLLALCLLSFPQGLASRYVLVLGCLFIFGFASWRWVLEPEELTFIRREFGPVASKILTGVNQ